MNLSGKRTCGWVRSVRQLFTSSGAWIYTGRHFGDKAKLLHYVKADVA